jgi:hypothetical protein
MVDYTVIIETFEVLDNERTARINGTSGNVEPKHPGPFKLSNDSDSQFLAMCDICARMVGVDGNTFRTEQRSLCAFLQK